MGCPFLAFFSTLFKERRWRGIVVWLLVGAHGVVVARRADAEVGRAHNDQIAARTLDQLIGTARDRKDGRCET